MYMLILSLNRTKLAPQASQCLLQKLLQSHSFWGALLIVQDLLNIK
jgi:hypothetical protein